MTSIFSNSSKHFRDININKPSINPEPKGISLLNLLGCVEIIKIALKEPINKTGARASGPIIVPIPPNNINHLHQSHLSYTLFCKKNLQSIRKDSLYKNQSKST